MLLEFIVNVGRTRIDGKKEALNDTVYERLQVRMDLCCCL